MSSLPKPADAIEEVTMPSNFGENVISIIVELVELYYRNT